MFAAGHGNLEVVKQLMELGANMQITTTDNRTLLYACWFGNCEIVKLLLPMVELREYTMRSKATWNTRTVIEFVQEQMAHKPEKPYQEILNLLVKSHEEKLTEVGTRTG